TSRVGGVQYGFFCSRRRRHTRSKRDWSSDVCSSDLAIGECEDLVVVGHSFGGFTAALVAERLAASQLIYVAAMIPSPGERPADWWENTGYAEAVTEQARLDGGLTGHEDSYLSFYHQVPRELADEAMRRSRGQTMTSSQAPWPLAQHPAVPTHVLVCRDDRFFPAELLHRV